MESFRLESTTIGPDTECAACGIGLDLHWYTEYGDPMNGTYKVECPNCNAAIEIVVEVVTSYRTSLSKDRS